MKVKLFLILTSLGILVLTARFILPADGEVALHSPNKQQGVCWVGGREIVSKNEFAPLLTNHINWISQTPFGWLASPSDPNIRMNTGNDHVWWGESDFGIAETTALARNVNIQTMLKPHLWVRGSWPGEIKMGSSEAWDLWFSSYRQFILHYAQLAEANQIEILCVGTELMYASAYEAEWRNLIEEIRKIYSGKITYAANFDQEYEKVKFWDALDFIGIQAYFPLSQNNNPSAEEMAVNWTAHLKSIEQIHKQYGKPVIFTEIGYRSTEDAAIEPWKWPQENRNAVSSAETQAKCYEAFFNSAWTKPWLAGAYFWKWYPSATHSLVDIDFTPQGKLAEKVLFEHFRKKEHDQ